MVLIQCGNCGVGLAIVNSPNNCSCCLWSQTWSPETWKNQVSAKTDSFGKWWSKYFQAQLILLDCTAVWLTAGSGSLLLLLKTTTATGMLCVVDPEPFIPGCSACKYMHTLARKAWAVQFRKSCPKSVTACFWQSCAKETKLCQLLFPASCRPIPSTGTSWHLSGPASPNTSAVSAVLQLTLWCHSDCSAPGGNYTACKSELEHLSELPAWMLAVSNQNAGRLFLHHIELETEPVFIPKWEHSVSCSNLSSTSGSVAVQVRHRRNRQKTGRWNFFGPEQHFQSITGATRYLKIIWQTHLKVWACLKHTKLSKCFIFPHSWQFWGLWVI